MTQRKIILTGFMGSGKSSVSILLASRLGISVIEMDQLLLERSPYSAISDIFAERGEVGFRDLEAEVARSLRDEQNLVISTGGGIIGRPENMENLKHGGGTIVFLRTSFDEVARRISNLDTRPLFRDHAKAEELFAQRLPLYTRYADIIVDTDGKTPEEVSAEIVTKVKTRE